MLMEMRIWTEESVLYVRLPTSVFGAIRRHPTAHWLGPCSLLGTFPFQICTNCERHVHAELVKYLEHTYGLGGACGSGQSGTAVFTDNGKWPLTSYALVIAHWTL